METAAFYPIYIVADSSIRASALTHRLSPDGRFGTQAFTSAEACRQAMLDRPPLLVIIAADFAAAVPLVETAQMLQPPATAVVVASAHPATDSAYPLLEAGASALYPANAHIVRQLSSLARRLAAERMAAQQRPANLVGASQAMHVVFQLIRKAALAPILVSIRGETGTGKEEVARAIHAASAHANEPFVGLNMAAVPRDLLESELFGHEKGAFPGAFTTRVGHFELAGNGTLFLDEIADLDLSLQAKLLRVLQERSFTRVGGTQPRPLTARLIVATHADLPQCVRAGTFRDDLYYRLLGLPISLPPLRERGEDVLLLAERFLEEFCPPGTAGPCRFSPAARRRLLDHPYPGNVRELRAVVELAAVLADSDQIEADDINFPPDRLDADSAGPVVTTGLTLRQHIINIVQHYLNQYNGNVVAVASHLGVGKSTLYRMIQSGDVKMNQP